MIEKPFLPMRLLLSQSQQFLSDHCAERVNPLGKRDARRRSGDEEMNVIRHDHIATDCDAVFFSSLAE